MTELATVRAWIDDARRVVALTGAGLSTDSGIPDFRGPQGIWTTNPKAEKLSNIHHYMSDPDVRRLAWQSRLTHPAWQAEPNAGHYALVHLEGRGKLHAVVTQNIDGLHQRAGHDPDRVIELHGNAHGVECLGCGDWQARQEIHDRVTAGEEEPVCARCGGILKPTTVSFGQSMPEEEMRLATELSMAADLFISIGSSLVVEPAASFPRIAKQSGARLVILNNQETPLDYLADIVIREQIGATMRALLDRL